MIRAQETATKRMAQLRRVAGGLALSLGLGAACFGGYLGLLQYTGNIHAVEAGHFYRSAQLDRDEFEHVIKSYGIKSILNLRGKDPGRPWYDEEMAISKALAVTHYDYGISARQFVTARQIDEILQIVRSAPKPILVHCRSGADRTGLVAALYLAKIDGVKLDRVDAQLSLIYGHFPYLTSKTIAMDESFWSYVRAPHR
jgi:protein tyrosine/serine phosphatase